MISQKSRCLKVSKGSQDVDSLCSVNNIDNVENVDNDGNVENIDNVNNVDTVNNIDTIFMIDTVEAIGNNNLDGLCNSKLSTITLSNIGLRDASASKNERPMDDGTLQSL